MAEAEIRCTRWPLARCRAKFTDGNGALVLRILHPDGMETGYAHMANYSTGTGVGAYIKTGQRIGTVGNTGKVGYHLHGGCKNTKVAGSPEVDWWPFLWQNKAGWIASSGVNVRSSVGSGSTMGPVFASSKPDGYLHRASDNKNLGATLTKRGLRQPLVGASYNIGGKSSNLWLPIWLDGAWRYVALPLARTT